LVLIPNYGTRIWLKKKYIKNYDKLNMQTPYDLQKIELIDDDFVEFSINNGISKKMLDLCKYEKKERR